jgi:membrane protein
MSTTGSTDSPGAMGRLVTVGKSFAGEVSEKRVTFIAASLAYYAFVSLIPLLLLLLLVATVFGGPELAETIRQQAGSSLPESAGELLSQALESDTTTGGATVAGGVSLLVLLWSALKVFRGLDVAFSRAYGRDAGGIAEQVKNGLVTLVAVVVGIAVTVVTGAAISVARDVGYDLVFRGISFVGTVGNLLLLAALTLTLLPLYYVLPGTGITVREALPGAAFAAVGWTLLQTAFRIYAGNAGSYEAYGVLGAVLLLVTLLYFAGMVLLLGVVLNAVLAGRTGGVEGVTHTESEWGERLRSGGQA